MRRALKSLVRKELQQTSRDHRMMVLLIAVPTVQIIVFGYAIDLEVDRVPTVLVDLDQTVETRTHTRRLFADGSLIAKYRTPDLSSAERLLVDGDVSLALVFPAGFQKDVLRGRPATLQALVDGSDPNRGRSAGAFVASYFRGESAAAALSPVSAAPSPPSLRPKLAFNPDMDTAKYMLPGIIGVLLMLITTVVSAMGLARERQTGTLEQLMVTPMRSSTVILGKILPFAGFGFLDLTLALTAAVVLFDVPTRGALAEVYAVAGLYLVGTLSTGLLISTLSRTQQQAFLGGFLFLLPAVLLSGILTPVRGMPEWLQVATWVNPLRHFVELMRSNLLAGSTALDRWPHLVALTIYGVCVTGLAIFRYRKTLE